MFMHAHRSVRSPDIKMKTNKDYLVIAVKVPIQIRRCCPSFNEAMTPCFYGVLGGEGWLEVTPTSSETNNDISNH